MSKTKLNAPICFTEKYEAVDVENKVLRGVVIAQEGEAKGHGVRLNKKFIKDVIAKGKEFGEVGVKSRFGHPNMCSDALGTYLGRYKNFRGKHNQDDETKPYQAIADLYLDDSAKITPNGNLSEYILKLAATDPAAFGNSIVFRAGETQFKEEDDGNGGKREIAYATIAELHESDLVDSPAATNALFSELSQMGDGELAYLATNFLDDHPEIFDVLSKNPEIMEEFMDKYSQYKDLKNPKSKTMEAFDKAMEKLDALMQKFTKLFEKEPEAVVEPVVEPTEEFSEAAKEKITAYEKEIKDMQAEITELKSKQVDEVALKAYTDLVDEAKALKEELSEIKSTWEPPTTRETTDPVKKLSKVDEVAARIEAKKNKTEK